MKALVGYEVLQCRTEEGALVTGSLLLDDDNKVVFVSQDEQKRQGLGVYSTRTEGALSDFEEVETPVPIE